MHCRFPQPVTSWLRNCLLLILVAVCFVSTASAQQAPSLGYVYPPVVSPGQTTEVALGGYDLTPDLQFFVHDDRVTLTPHGPPGEFFITGPPYWFGPRGFTTAMRIPREIPARLQVAEDCPPGPIRWQMANANGSSATAVVLISDRPEILEDRFRDDPQILRSLPIGVSGRLSRITEVDRYQVQVEQDGPVTVELFARRLGSNLNGVIQVRDDKGRMLVDVADTQGMDAAATFAAQAGRPYIVSLHDVDFRGHRSFVYRLAVTGGPRVLATVPAAGWRGTTQKTEFIGIGVATGKAQLESITRDVTFPASDKQQSLRFQLQTPFGTAPAIEIPLSSLNEQRDVERLEVPSAITATFQNTDVRTFSFRAVKGEPLRVEVKGPGFGTELDLTLSIHDADGKQLAENDDLAGRLDAGLDFTAPADGEFSCVVREVSGQPLDAASCFRLSIEKPQTGFRLTVPQQLNLPIGGKAQLAIKALRSGGFKEEIAISVEGLPDGVTVSGEAKIPAGKNDLKLNIEASPEAAALAGFVVVSGEAMIGEQLVRQVALAPAAGNLCPRDPLANETSRVLLATTMKPPFTLELVDRNRQRAVHRGTTYPAEFIIKRDEGFAGEVQMMMAAAQSRHRQGIHGPIVKVPADADRALYPSFMPEWLSTKRTTRMSVLGMAQVVDPKGNRRYLAKPAAARITMILEGALLKVSHQAGELTVRAGNSFEIPVTIFRSSKFPAEVTVSLDIPNELTGTIECEPVTVDPGQMAATLKIRTQTGKRLSGRWPLTINATAFRDDRWLVLSQTEASVEFEAAPE